ncbi:MAG: hypothetical protein R3D27_04465 [Hyphomicrobiaceae bacterium]
MPNTAPAFAVGDGIVTTDISGSNTDAGRSVTMQPDGRIVVAGYSVNGANDDFALVRYNADGTLDTSFGGGDGIVTTPVGSSTDQGFSVAMQPDGRIVVAGSSRIGSADDFALVRYNADGTLDTSFGGGDGIVTTPIGSSVDSGQSVTVQPDGRIVVAGYSLNGRTTALVRYNADGTLDTALAAATASSPRRSAVRHDFTKASPLPAAGRPDRRRWLSARLDFALVRYNADGTLDTSFGGGDGIVTTPIGSSSDVGNSVTMQPDGRIVVAGYSFNGANADFALVRYNADGTLDTSFGGGDGIVTTPVGSSFDRL